MSKINNKINDNSGGIDFKTYSVTVTACVEDSFLLYLFIKFLQCRGYMN